MSKILVLAALLFNPALSSGYSFIQEETPYDEIKGTLQAVLETRIDAEENETYYDKQLNLREYSFQLNTALNLAYEAEQAGKHKDIARTFEFVEKLSKTAPVAGYYYVDYVARGGLYTKNQGTRSAGIKALANISYRPVNQKDKVMREKFQRVQSKCLGMLGNILYYVAKPKPGRQKFIPLTKEDRKRIIDSLLDKADKKFHPNVAGYMKIVLGGLYRQKIFTPEELKSFPPELLAELKE